MEFAFYICGLIAILATLRVITHTNPVPIAADLAIELGVGLAHHRRLAQLADQRRCNRIDICQLININGTCSHLGFATGGKIGTGHHSACTEQGHGRQQRNELNPFHYHTLLSLPSRTERKNRRMIAGFIKTREHFLSE